MLNKVLEILKSRRFWFLTLTAILAVIKLDPITLPEILTVLQGWLIAITAVGTWDKFATSVAKK
jgi:hypothetical protein